MCFQVQFIKVDFTASTKNAIKYALKKERLLARWKRDLAARERKYHEDPEKKLQAVKKRNHDKKETIKECKKQKCQGNPAPKITCQKAKYQENPDLQLVYIYKKNKYHENPENKMKYQKAK